MLRSALSEVAQDRGASWAGYNRQTILIVFQSKPASIFTDNGDIIPAKSLKSLPCYFTQGRRKVDEIDTGEEFGDIDKLGHGLNVPAGAAANLPLIR